MMKEIKISPEELRAKQQAAQAGRVKDSAGLVRAMKAAGELTHSGWLRRQIHEHREIPLELLCQSADITSAQLNDFLEGLGPLSTVQVDAICAALGIIPAGTEKVA
ncbi:hypothetical protein [Planctopirus limnophila]|nr:hypothetical protein [Planctopirus limnophila]